VLHPRAARRRFDLSLRPPAPDLADLVEHCWIVRWDLPDGDAHLQHTIPHPSVHLVVETQPGRSGIFGVMTSRFTRRIEGTGRVSGVKFRPAGFHPFLGSPVCALTDRVVAIRDVFGAAGEAPAELLGTVDDESSMVEIADAFVRRRRPAPDPAVPWSTGS